MAGYGSTTFALKDNDSCLVRRRRMQPSRLEQTVPIAKKDLREHPFNWYNVPQYATAPDNDRRIYREGAAVYGVIDGLDSEADNC